MELSVSVENRFFALLEQLKQMPACSSRQEAHDMLLQLWISGCEKAGAPSELLDSMRQRTICPEHGWTSHDLNTCSWDWGTSPAIRISLHDNGTIVIQRTDAGNSFAILHWGAARKPAEVLHKARPALNAPSLNSAA